MPTPFIKFPGGKGYLAETIISNFPLKYKTYYEPMIGGGAIFFELARRGKIKKAWLADINPNLINIYEQLRDHLPEMLKYLKALRRKHNQSDPRDLYYAVRKHVNRTTTPEIEKAAGLIYLSKTCFNGLFRFNSKGAFNAPVGDQKNPKICDEANLLRVSQALQKVQLSCCSYEVLERNFKKHDLVYLDPPYWPVRESSFTGYTASKFTKEDHEKLAKNFAKWNARGVYLLLSNSDTPEVRKLYKKFRIISVEAPRRINSNGRGRGLVKEVLIKNF